MTLLYISVQMTLYVLASADLSGGGTSHKQISEVVVDEHGIRLVDNSFAWFLMQYHIDKFTVCTVHILQGGHL
jgi:hypothetical protein